jgi:hypothetical protein
MNTEPRYVPSDAELVEHYYGESERLAEVEAALAADPALARRYADLRAVLGAVTPPAVPEPGPGYGEALWRRLAPALAEQRAALRTRRLWIAGGAVAALLALLAGAFVLGRGFGREQGHSQAIAEGLSKEARDRILLAAAIDHLDRTEVLLVGVKNAGPAHPFDVALARERAAELVVANRLLRRSAGESDPAVTGALSSVLGKAEPLLLEIAHAPDELKPDDLALLQQRLNERGTLFELRVLNDRLQRQAAPARPARTPAEV